MKAAQPGLKRLSVTAERLETASISLEKATEATKESCAELDAQVAKRLTEAQQRLEAAFEQVAQTIQPSLDQLTEASASLDKASGALKGSAVTALESTTALDAIFDKKLASLQMGTRDLEKAAANLGPICVSLQALEAGLTSGLDSFASQFKPSIEKAMGTFDSEMAGVAKQLHQVTRNLQESFDELNAQLSELLIEDQASAQPSPSSSEGWAEESS
jgi:chromosome segregation ATPase